MIVKNTFLDFDTGKPATQTYTRSNTWATSLCGLTEDGTSSGKAAVQDLERLPEDNTRAFVREVSSTSDASTEAPFDKRLQARDMYLMYGGDAVASVAEEGAGSSISSSPPNEESFSGDASGDGQAHAMQAGFLQAPVVPTMQDPWTHMRPALDSGELIVKNTFLQFHEEDHVPLRTVRTAAARLDLMG